MTGFFPLKNSETHFTQTRVFSIASWGFKGAAAGGEAGTSASVTTHYMQSVLVTDCMIVGANC